MPKHLQGEVRESQNRIRILSVLKVFLTCDAEIGLGARSGTDKGQSTESKVRRQLVWVPHFQVK